MTKTTTQESSSSGADLDRPSSSRPEIKIRNGGRQVFISTGRDPGPDFDLKEPDRAPNSSDSATGDLFREAVDVEGDPSATADGPPPPKRGKIDGFGVGPRRRLRDRLHAMKRDTEGVFLTLTYHESDPTPERAKRDLDVFWKRLRQRYEGEHVLPISSIWKMEPQERGVPHFHLIVYGLSFIPAQTVSRLWHEVTEEESEKHRKAGVDVESAVNEDGKLQAYMAKYMAETYDGWPGAEPGDPWAEMGRWWGCLGRDHLPVAEWEDTAVKIHQREAERLIRELLDEWDVDIPDGVIPRSLMVNCRGCAGQRLLDLMDRL